MSYQPLSEKTTNKDQASGYCGLNGSGTVPTSKLPVLVAAGPGHQGGLVPAPDTDPMGGADTTQLFANTNAGYTSTSGDGTTLNGRRFIYNGPPDFNDFFTVPLPGDFSVFFYARINASPQPGFFLSIAVTWYEQDGVTLRQKVTNIPTDDVGNVGSGTVFVSNPYDSHIFLAASYMDLAGPNPDWVVVFRVDYL